MIDNIHSVNALFLESKIEKEPYPEHHRTPPRKVRKVIPRKQNISCEVNLVNQRQQGLRVTSISRRNQNQKLSP